MSEIGIHTFMLTSRLSYEKYRELKELFQHSIAKKRENGGNSYIQSDIFCSFGYIGIIARLYMQNSFARLELIVNPTDLLCRQYMQTELFTDTRNIELLFDTLGQAVSNIDMVMGNFVISRIDLCTNIIAAPEIVRAYINLGRKSYKSKAVSEKRFADSKDNRHSLTLCSRDFEVGIYDKEYEIAKRNKLTPEQEFGRILRIEARIYRNAICCQCCQSFSALLKHCIDNGSSIIERCLCRCFDYGDYMSFPRAEEIVNTKDYKAKVKERMVSVLRSRAHIDRTYEELRIAQNMSEKGIYRLMTKFHDCCLSPVTIPVRDVNLIGEYLPCFVKLIYINEALRNIPL